MSRNHSVLITGAAGFVGGYTSTVFSAYGWKAIGVDRRGHYEAEKHPAHPKFDRYYELDLMNLRSATGMLEEHAPLTVVHLAGPANVGASFRDPSQDFQMQTLPLVNLLEAIRLSGTECRVLLVSSAAVYGNPVSLPINEDHRIMPISPYGYHKYQQELLLDEYYSLYGVKTCKARIFSTYGPGLKQLAVWDITRRALAGDYTVIGTGEETRDYLYAADVAQALRHICDGASFSGEIYNVASGNEIPIRDLARKIYSALGYDKEPITTGDETLGLPKRWRADITRLKQLGFVHKVSLDQGIVATVKWITANV